MKLPSLPALLACLATGLPAAASETNYSDLWWDPTESGWGVGLQRQGDIIFLTLFVYGADGASTWLVAPDARRDSGAAAWQGTLFRATGPAFAAPFDAPPQASAVGTATLEFDGANAATLRYTVDGASFSKRITRMTWREPSAAGRYHGGFSASVAECPDTTRVGAYHVLGDLVVTQSARQVNATISWLVGGLPSSCAFTATTSQAGRHGAWSGTYTCNLVIGHDDRGENITRVQRTGPFMLDRVAITPYGLHGALSAADQDCAFSGYFGGVRRP